MTVEELKVEAEKLGYKIVKPIKYVKLKPCICGCRRVYPEISLNPKGRYYRCQNCGLTGEISKYVYQSKINWNKAVEKNDK